MYKKSTKILVITLICLSMAILSGCDSKVEDIIDVRVLYEEAVVDAMVADEEEIFPLVTLDESDNLVTFNEEGEVLLLTWNSYPDSYKMGETVVLEYGHVWAFTDREIIKWYGENKDEMTDYNMRLRQLIGLDPSDDKTHMTALWADVKDVIRPAYITDPTTDIMQTTYREDMDIREWFDDNILDSYYSEYRYPWTRLGYTYDWADNGIDYGLTEFLIKENSEVSVDFTYTTEEFIEYMDSLVK